MDLSLFDYALPDDQIAQEPLADRAASRMLVLYRNEQRWEDRQFRDFPSFLQPSDCLVLNDSRVFPSRLLGKRGAAEVEVFLIEPVGPETWKALVRPGKKIGVGEHIRFGEVEAEVIARGSFGERTIRFSLTRDIYEWLNEAGHVPLPPVYQTRRPRARPAALSNRIRPPDRLGCRAHRRSALHAGRSCNNAQPTSPTSLCTSAWEHFSLFAEKRSMPSVSPSPTKAPQKFAPPQESSAPAPPRSAPSKASTWDKQEKRPCSSGQASTSNEPTPCSPTFTCRNPAC